MSFFLICCGGQEARKAQSLEDPSGHWDMDDDAGRKCASIHAAEDENRRKIRFVEHQISELGTSRARQMQLQQEHQLLMQEHQRARRTVCSKPVRLSDAFVPPVHEKSEEQVEFLKHALEGNFLFSALTGEEMTAFCLAMQKENVRIGDVICEQGHQGDFFYVVESGKVNFVDGVEIVGSCGDGGSFGELALLFDSPRAVSCIAASSVVKLWKVDQVTFRYLLAHHSENHCACVKAQLKDVDLFAGMDEQFVRRLVNAMVPVTWKAGDRIVQKGEKGDVFYLIRSGEVKVHDIGLGDSTFEDQVLNAGQSFGERALLTGEVRAANVTALTDVLTLAMDRNTFDDCIGPLKDVLEREMRRKMLSTLPLLSHNLSEEEIDHLLPLLTEVCYPRGFKLSEAGKQYDDPSLWFIRHGRVLVYDAHNPDTLYDLESGDHFGDDSIQNTDPTWTSSLTAVCEDNVTAWMLTKADIERVIGDVAVRLHLEGNGSSKSQTLIKHRRVSSIAPGDLLKHRVLGTGAFGKVFLVSHRQTSETFALKSISKRKLLESHQTAAVRREKELLQLLSHPFILHLVASFQDENHLYLVLPVVPGGELFSVLQKRRSRTGGLPAHDAAFYAACVIEGLGHFHQRSVAYRDLKLENVLIGEDGYCVIVDLGFAKVVTDKTYTLVGTPEYISPEILLSRGYDKAVDYWSFGVLVYELLIGKSPFFQRGSSQIEMFKRIVKVEYDFPDFAPSSAADMIKRLLNRRPSERLGNLVDGYLGVKSHPWFNEEGIAFSKVLKKVFKAPWIPEVKDPLVLSSTFDNNDYSMADVDEGRKLTRYEQEIFRDF